MYFAFGSLHLLKVEVWVNLHEMFVIDLETLGNRSGKVGVYH
jgi:hypothetical protein